MESSSPLRPVVGIDVSKSTLDCFIDRLDKSFTVPNDPDGHALLIGELRQANAALVLVESTGRYHRRLAAELLDADVPVAVVNPQRARQFARSCGKIEKTDRIDARVLAQFARALDHAPATRPHPRQVELSDLVSRRRALVQQRIAEKNRLGEQAPASLAQRQGVKMLRLIEQQIEDLDRAMARLIERDDEWNNTRQILTSVPGVADTTAHQLIAELPELGKLNRGQIAKLAGLAPMNRDSGSSSGKRRIMGGRQPVRWALYMATFSAMRFCPRFARHAKKLKDAGKPFKVIITACMRKLLVTLNQMVKTNTRYQAWPA